MQAISNLLLQSVTNSKDNLFNINWNFKRRLPDLDKRLYHIKHNLVESDTFSEDGFVESAGVIA